MTKTVEQRVDILLREGVDSPKKWAKVHGYVEPRPEDVVNWQHAWHQLRSHHLDETSFLFDIIRELVKRCNDRTSETG